MQRRKADTNAIQVISQETDGTEDDTQSKAGYKDNSRLTTLALGVGLILVAALTLPNTSSDNMTLDGPELDGRLSGPAMTRSGRLGDADKKTSPLADNDKVDYRIVFSTGCSTYQDWQSYIFFYQAMAANQPGTVTRIVSGCNDEDRNTLQKIFDEQIAPMAPGRFKIHFTPDYSKIKDGHSFVYFNKPFGMRHWLQNAIGFPDKPDNEDAIVVLMDPDQIILRPFTNNNFTNTQWKFLKKGEEPRTMIEHGKPMGQLYGFGLQWKHKVNMTLVSPSEPSPVDKMSYSEAQAGYIVGPPYIATARDMYKIVTKWCDFAIPVHDQYPHLLAEMFAYCLGAAHLRLSHQTALSFMVSDTRTGGEGWSYVDKLSGDEVCSPKSVEDLPNVIHFCQRYGVGPWFFGKRRLPKDFLQCESPLLREPPADLESDHILWPDGSSKALSPGLSKRNKFMLCHLIRVANSAAMYFKKNHCSASQSNFDKTLVFNEKLKV